jgi:hypothetical protein
MKTAAMLVGGLLLSALLSGPAAAEQVRVKVTARVSEVSDPGNALGGKIVFGQRVTGTYVYNTNTPNLSPYPGSGHYVPYANEARMRFVAGSLVFESVQPTQSIMIDTHSQASGEGQFDMFSTENNPLANGAIVETIALDIRGTGNVTESAALANAAPNLTNYHIKDIVLNGTGNGSFYFVRAELEVAERVIADAIVVSPASGSFVANQHFDASVTLPRNTTVANAHALANGVMLPLTYPGNCQLQAPNSAGKRSLLCAGADAALPIAAGAPIEWTVELTNGAILTETVTWELAQ